MYRYYKQYFDALTKEVMPFWMKNAIDESGAINNCISEDGTVLSRNRYIWSQGRALWTFSALYNRIEKKKEYLDVATGIFNYLVSLGVNEEGGWNYLYDGDGNVLEGDVSIYVDGFVLTGMTEYYIATGNEKAKEIGIAIYENTLKRINTPGSYKVSPYVIPDGMQTHGVNMIFSFFYTNFGRAIGREDIEQAGYKLAMEVLEKYYHEDRDIICEFINTDGSFTNTSEERACVPGHVIECMWFLITIFEKNNETDKIKKCCDLIKRHIELGWDETKGGITLAFDIDGVEPCFWQKPTYKPWWVQVEALVATAYAYKHTGDQWFMDMHVKINDYAFSHYPNGYGDWYNWLDFDGKVGESAALPVKDPFHLPRGLMYLCELLNKRSIKNENIKSRQSQR